TGQIKTSTQSLELLKNLAINSLATAMFRGANAIIREKAESGLASLVPAAASNPNDTANEQYGSRTAWTNWILGYRHGVIPLEGVLQPHQREALFFFQQALDLHKGFGSMAVDSRRTPDREPPLLARFGADIGKVKYVNARDINQFPGRGFLIACLDLDRALVADKRFDIRDKRRYARYAEAWPDLADELVDLRHAQFMLTRGMVVISSNPRSKYSLKMPSGSWVHYSLVIFNDHFHNFPPVIALLVPTEVLQKKCKGAFVSYEDFRGFDLQKKDINTERITPQGLIEDSKDYGYGAIEFTGARALTLGLAGLLVNFHGPYQQLLRTRAKLYREWNRNPALHYHDEGDVLGYSITAIETEIERVFNSIINPGGAANGNQLRKLLSRYFNEWTLFKVIKGLWGKGETAGKVEGQEFEPLPDQLEPQWDQNQEAAFNPAATRMLREAYRWHAERAPGHGEKSAKVLVAASSLDYSSLPNSPFFLNTADMTVKFGDRLVRLPIDSDGSGIDEQIFWRSEIMSHMSDTFTEFRFLEGQVFGIH
ncbi:MAG: hypothetical protein DCC75_12540, partial [Proteobacteria bacterium]